MLLGQYAALPGALPFPQFLAFIAIGHRGACRPQAKITAVGREVAQSVRSALPHAAFRAPDRH
jgi:hypothetical protein